MVRLTLLVGLSVSLSACWLDPTCQDTCSGSKIVRCDWECSGSNKLDIDECHRENGGTDCADQIAPSGNPRTCRLRPVEGGPDSPFCIDATQPSCDPNTEGVKCSGVHETTQCIATTEGGIAKVLQEDVCTEVPNQMCVDGDNGVRCEQQ